MAGGHRSEIWQRDGLMLQRHPHRNASIPPNLVGNPDLPLGSPYPYSGQQVLSFAILLGFPLLSVVVCGLRIYGKQIANNIGLDDLVMGFALTLAIAQAGLMFTFGRMAFLGVHEYDIPLHDRNSGLLENYLSDIVYIPILALAKISAIMFLFRIGVAKPRLRYFLHAMLWIHAAQIIVHVVLTVFECTPISSVWDLSVKGRCVNIAIYSLAITAFNVTSDLLVLSVPLIVLRDLTTNKKARNVLIAVFMLGIITTIVSCIRFYFIYVTFFDFDVRDGRFFIAYVTAPVECNMAIVTASAPALWPLARRMFPSLFEGLGINGPRYADFEADTSPGNRRRRGSGRTTSIFWRVRWTLTKPTGHGEFATHTIGGTSFAMETIDEDRTGVADQTRAREHANNRTLQPAVIRDDSDADILETYHNFLRETESTAAYDNDAETMMSYEKPWSRGTDRSGTEWSRSRGKWSNNERAASPASF